MEPIVDVLTIRTPGLGDATHLLAHDGVGILVDPQRDVDRFLESAAEAGVTIRWVLETHLHNDYVSGAPVAAARSGAELVLPAGAGAAYPHTAAFHRERLSSGSLEVEPIHTPGHTPEHTSYLVSVDGDPVAVFSGGSLLVGSAGRTDLLGAERALQLAILQHGSVRRLAALPPQVGLYPTHGQGSFCTSGPAGRDTSTIGAERESNEALGQPDAETFATTQLDGLPPYPTYYAHMGRINVMGPPPMPDARPASLGPAELAALAPGVAVVDVRPRRAFGEGHVPGSLGVEISEQVGVWVGWLVAWGTPVALVAKSDEDADEARVQLARVGYDDVRGVLVGLDRWRDEGRAVASFRLLRLDGFRAAADRGGQVLDVRAPDELREAALPGAVHRYLPDLVDGPPPDLERDREVLIVCASGFRSTIAASLLAPRGFDVAVLEDAGVEDLLGK